MKIDRIGITRIVLIFNTFVIKLPKLKNGWNMFLRSLLCNIEEGKAWNNAKYNGCGREQLLCPVIYYSKSGLILIMKKADVNRHLIEMKGKDQYKLDYYKKFKDAHYGDDLKPHNFGYYEDRLVKIDYGNV